MIKRLNCPICGHWIATIYYDEHGNIITSGCSSVYIEENKPFYDCQNDNCLKEENK